jgi:hypothetical protein
VKSRRSFLSTVASGSVGLSLATLDPAAAQSSPSPAASATAKPASAASVALATAMRARFDEDLTDHDVQTIAKAIDDNSDAAKLLNPKKKRLKNSDAPVLHFTVSGGEA